MSTFLKRRFEALRVALEAPVLDRVTVPLRVESAPNRTRGASMGGLVVAARVKKTHRIVGFSAGRRFAGQLTTAPFHVVRIVRIGAKELDDDNLDAAFKAVRDGVAKGLGVDDRDPRIRYVPDQELGDWGVRLELYASHQHTYITTKGAP